MNDVYDASDDVRLAIQHSHKYPAAENDRFERKRKSGTMLQILVQYKSDDVISKMKILYSGMERRFIVTTRHT